MLIAIIVASVAGPLPVWPLGHGIDVFGHFSIPSALPGILRLHELTEGFHGLAGNLIMPLLILHVLGAVKHALTDRDGDMQRIVAAAANGR